jgi:hypothetical protein
MELSVLEIPRIILAYFGPETTLPLASIMGAVVGVLLIFWNFLTGLVAKCFRRVFKKADNASAPGTSQVLPTQGTTALEGSVVAGEPGMNVVNGSGS